MEETKFTGWECPACCRREYTLTPDGRKECRSCKRIWGKQQKQILAKIDIGEETEKEFKTIKALTYFLMQTDERCRDDDKWLVYSVYQEIARQHGKKIFIPFEIYLCFPAFETISRCRRYIQNEQKELYPRTQKQQSEEKKEKKK